MFVSKKAKNNALTQLGLIVPIGLVVHHILCTSIFIQQNNVNNETDGWMSLISLTPKQVLTCNTAVVGTNSLIL